MPRDPLLAPLVMAMPPSPGTFLTWFSTSPAAAGDAGRSPVIAVGDGDAIIDLAIIDFVVNVARRGKWCREILRRRL